MNGQSVSEGLRIGEVARLLDMHEKNHSTLRLWIATFGHYLTPSGRGGGGRERCFLDHDLQVLNLVRTLRNEGQNFEAIAEALDRQVATPGSEHRSAADLAAEVSRLRDNLIKRESELARREAEVERLRTEIEAVRRELSTYKVRQTLTIVARPFAGKSGVDPADLGLTLASGDPTPCPDCAAVAVQGGVSPTGRRFLCCSACGWVRSASRGLPSKRMATFAVASMMP